MTAAEFAKELNDKARAEMAADSNLWIGMLAEDAEHWASYGITTADQLGDYLDACCKLDPWDRDDD